MFLLAPLPEQCLLRIPAGRGRTGAEPSTLCPVVLPLVLDGLACAVRGVAATGGAGLVGVGEGGGSLRGGQDDLQQQHQSGLTQQ